MQQTIVISKQEYFALKKKAEFADDVLSQLQSSLADIEHGRIKKAIH